MLFVLLLLIQRGWEIGCRWSSPCSADVVKGSVESDKAEFLVDDTVSDGVCDEDTLMDMVQDVDGVILGVGQCDG